MVSNIPSEEVRASKAFKLQNVRTEALYELFKWCKTFSVMTPGKSRDGVHVPSAPKYIDAVRSAFAVETHDSGAGGLHSAPSAVIQHLHCLGHGDLYLPKHYTEDASFAGKDQDTAASIGAAGKRFASAC
jgi:hypothetical protein